MTAEEEHWAKRPVGPVQLQQLAAVLLVLMLLFGTSKGPFYNEVWGDVIFAVMLISNIILLTWGWLKRG